MHDIFLGGLQGLTEFLPVSSSGHLALAQRLLDLNDDVVARTVIFHVGTMLSCITFFFRDIVGYLRQRRLLGYILTATFLTALFGLAFRALLEPLFASPFWIGVFLILNGSLLLLTRRAGAVGRRRITLADSCVLGIAQGIAILPGISRAGVTISALLLRGCDREEAFRFSFIASLPAVGAAFIYEGVTAHASRLLGEPSVYLGIAMAYLVGLIALTALKGLLLMKRFYLFGFYCLAMGALVLLVII